ncbi:MAG: SGNH/GDSL hydrolase family protein [Candidatus Hinthialibacter sp.]
MGHFTFKYSRKYSRLIHVCLILAASALSALAFEFLFRLAIQWIDPQTAAQIKSHVEYSAKEQTAVQYHPHPYLSYVRADTAYEDGKLRIQDQFFSKRKPEDVYRIACLGGSTTMNQFPRYLQDDLERVSLGRRFEVMDFGCNGWTLVESAINYLIRAADYSPDAVLVHHGMNDSFPRIWPDFQVDYSHYRIAWRDQSGWMGMKWFPGSWVYAYLQMKNDVSRVALRNYTVRRVPQESITYEPAPESVETFTRTLRNLVWAIRSRGGKIVLAPVPFAREYARQFGSLLEEHKACMVEAGKEMHIPVADADVLLDGHPEIFRDVVHVNDLGNRIKSQVYAAAIWKALQDLEMAWNWDDLISWGEGEAPGRIAQEILVQWDLNLPDVRDFHVYVFDEAVSEFVYLGRTGSGEVHSLRWKPGSAQVAPRFRRGPAAGRPYRFRVFALPIDEEKDHIGPFEASYEAVWSEDAK